MGASETDGLPPERALFYEIIRTLEDLRAPHHALFKEHGLSGPAFNVLRELLEHERRGGAGARSGLPTETVAARMLSRDPDVSRISKRLVERGLLRKERDRADGRVHRLILTKHGRDLTRDLVKRSHRLLRRRFAVLDREEMRAMTDILRRLQEPGPGDQSV